MLLMMKMTIMMMMTTMAVAAIVRVAVVMIMPIAMVLRIVTTKRKRTTMRTACGTSFCAGYGRQIRAAPRYIYSGHALQEDGIAVEEHLCSAPEAVKQLLEEVGGRSVALNARAPPGAQRERQLSEVLEAVGQVVDKQGPTPFMSVDKPKKLRMKQARRLRQQQTERGKQEAAAMARREGKQVGAEGGGSPSWLGWLLGLVAPPSSTTSS
jgi:hypothetical protein